MDGGEAARALGQYDHGVLLELALHSLDKDFAGGAGGAIRRFRCRDRLQALLAAHQRGINFAGIPCPLRWPAARAYGCKGCKLKQLLLSRHGGRIHE